MIVSMTSFARIDFKNQSISGSWEIRSVNHRFNEITIKVPDEYRKLEKIIRKNISACAKRGKIDCHLRIDNHDIATNGISLNPRIIDALLNSVNAISTKVKSCAEVNPLDILRWPGVINNEDSGNNLDKYLTEQLALALAEFSEAREKEGRQIEHIVNSRLLLIDKLLTDLKLAVPSIIDSITARQRLRMEQFITDIDPTRLEQECALLMSKLDVAEEIDRVAIHIEETRCVLKRAEPVGRRLDFLMQELLREANTLGSKSAHADSTGAAIELKVLIEQIKEQIQNVE